MKLVRVLVVTVAAVTLSACGGGAGDGSSNTSPSYYSQGGLLWSETLPGLLGNGQYVWSFAAKPSESAGYQCDGSVSVNYGPIVPDNFNKEAGWRLPKIAELSALYAENKTPPNWQIGKVWADSLTGPQRLNFITGAITSGDGLTGLVVCVKPQA